MKTVKEMAALCGVSDEAIRQWLQRNGIPKQRIQGTKPRYVIDEPTEAAILGYFKSGITSNQANKGRQNQENKPSKEANLAESGNKEITELLKKQLEVLQAQLEVKDKQLDQQVQQLSAKDEQIKEKDKQLERLHDENAALTEQLKQQHNDLIRLLDQQQQLSAADKYLAAQDSAKPTEETQETTVQDAARPDDAARDAAVAPDQTAGEEKKSFWKRIKEFFA